MGKALLSISMLISGKEDMFKSLDSLMYFKKSFPTEIILVDTGCKPEQRARAEKYADKIVNFTWCGDFAAARNCGLKEATGEWFMYLDDDEWFDNPQEIIHFFISGEYKEYNCASYIVRNYIDFEGAEYNDSYPSRMVKLEPGTKFVGRIHEYLDPYRLPKKTFGDFAHHYGYAYKNEEIRRKHAKRNLKPLFEMRKACPGDPRWMCQLAQEYYGLEEYEETIHVCENGLKEWEKLKRYITFAPAHVGALYAYILTSLEYTEKYEEEEKWLKKALNSSIVRMPHMEPTVAFYYLVAAGLYSNVKDYETCWKYFQKYIDSYEIYRDDRDRIEDGTAAITDSVYQERLLYGTILRSIESVIRMDDFVLCKKVFYMMDWSDTRLLGQVKFEKQIVDGCCNVEYNNVWVEILQTLVSRKDGMKEMYPVFLEKEIEYKKEGKAEQLTRLRHLVSQLDYPHRYILYTKILWQDQNVENQESQVVIQKLNELFDELFQEYSRELFEIKEEVWNVADKWHIDLESKLLDVKFVIWRRCLDSWILKARPEEISTWRNRIQGWQQHEDIRYDLFAIKCTEGYLRNVEPLGYSMEQMESLMWKYADQVLNLYQPIVNADGTSEVYADEIKMAFRIQGLKQARKYETDQEVLTALRMIKDTYETLNGTMAYYAKLYKEEVHNRNNEMEELAAKLKQNVKILIHMGNLDDAETVIKQLEQYWPGDAELTELKNKLQMD